MAFLWTNTGACEKYIYSTLLRVPLCPPRPVIVNRLSPTLLTSPDPDLTTELTYLARKRNQNLVWGCTVVLIRGWVTSRNWPPSYAYPSFKQITIAALIYRHSGETCISPVNLYQTTVHEIRFYSSVFEGVVMGEACISTKHVSFDFSLLPVLKTHFFIQQLPYIKDPLYRKNLTIPLRSYSRLKEAHPGSFQYLSTFCYIWGKG